MRAVSEYLCRPCPRMPLIAVDCDRKYELKVWGTVDMIGRDRNAYVPGAVGAMNKRCVDGMFPVL